MTYYYEAGNSDGFAAAVGQWFLRLRHMRMSTAFMNECGRIWKKIDHDLFLGMFICSRRDGYFLYYCVWEGKLQLLGLKFRNRKF